MAWSIAEFTEQKKHDQVKTFLYFNLMMQNKNFTSRVKSISISFIFNNSNDHDNDLQRLLARSDEDQTNDASKENHNCDSQNENNIVNEPANKK